MMCRYIFLSCTILCVLTLVSFIPQHAIESNLKQQFKNTRISLEGKYGRGGNLSHVEARRLYRKVLSEVGDMVHSMDKSDDDVKAEVCSFLRSAARRYARSRDSSSLIANLFLQARDAYVHGLRYLPLAVIHDVQDTLNSGVVSLSRVALTVRGILSCLVPSLGEGECPSFDFLTVVRKKTTEQILSSCTKSNEKYDTVYQ